VIEKTQNSIECETVDPTSDKKEKSDEHQKVDMPNGADPSAELISSALVGEVTSQPKMPTNGPSSIDNDN